MSYGHLGFPENTLLNAVLRPKRASAIQASTAHGASDGPSDGGSDVFEYIAGEIGSKGYVVLDSPLPQDLLDQLFLEFTALDREAFKQAGVGRQQAHRLNDFLRRDHVYWLDSNLPQLQGYFDWMEQLRLCINRNLFLGLFDYECHYAYYPEGAFYKKHVDAFKGQSNRRLSTVLYLNPQWQQGDGGELALYREDTSTPFLTVSPRYGGMVVFLSEKFPHEVLRANCGRFSLTGWHRCANLGE